MQIFHTSPTEITKINKIGLFGSALCFSDDVYVMTAGDYVIYRLDIDESEIIDAGSFFYRDDTSKLDEIVSRIMKVIGCDRDAAEELLSQREQLDDAEDSWWLQSLACEAAVALGYRGASMLDEQGTVYLIDMIGRESELAIYEADNDA